MRAAGATALVVRREAVEAASKQGDRKDNEGIRGWGEPAQLFLSDIKAFASGDD